jgi:hypothetical protein
MNRFNGLVWALIALLLSVCTAAFAAEERTANMKAMELNLAGPVDGTRKDGHSAGYGNWLLGYLSGVNLWGPTGGRDLLRHRNGQEMIEWVDKFCRVFPNDEIEFAARQLILDLGQRAR